MMAPMTINGPQSHPLAIYLRHKCPGNHQAFVEAPFEKFLVDTRGRPVRRYSNMTSIDKIEDDVKYDSLCCTSGVRSLSCRHRALMAGDVLSTDILQLRSPIRAKPQPKVSFSSSITLCLFLSLSSLSLSSFYHNVYICSAQSV